MISVYSTVGTVKFIENEGVAYVILPNSVVHEIEGSASRVSEVAADFHTHAVHPSEIAAIGIPRAPHHIVGSAACSQNLSFQSQTSFGLVVTEVDCKVGVESAYHESVTSLIRCECELIWTK